MSFSYYEQEDLLRFKDSNFIFVNHLIEFENITKNFDYFLVASWRDYGPLVKILKKNKKKIIVYSEAGGIDYWDLGVNDLFFKSKANLLLYTKARRNHFINLYRKFICRNAHITGSLRYQYYEKYKLDTKNNLEVIIFPKSLSNVEKKIRSWFKNRLSKNCIKRF